LGRIRPHLWFAKENSPAEEVLHVFRERGKNASHQEAGNTLGAKVFSTIFASAASRAATSLVTLSMAAGIKRERIKPYSAQTVPDESLVQRA
jgi:hypothetical protein